MPHTENNFTAKSLGHGVKCFRHLPLLVSLLFLLLLIYGVNLNDFFLSDDFGLLEGSSQSESILNALGLKDRSWFRPAVHLTWMLNYLINKNDSLGYHLFNLMIHLLNAWLLGQLVFRLIHSEHAAYLAAVFYAIFPIHHEVVVWVSGRFDGLCATGCLAALLYWTKYNNDGGNWRHLVASCSFFLLALCSKEMATALPMLALALACCFCRPFPRRTYAGMGLLFGMLGLYAIARISLLGGFGGYVSESGESLHSRVDIEHVIGFTMKALRHSLIPVHQQLNPGQMHLLRIGPAIAICTAIGLWIRCRQGRALLRWTSAFLFLFLLSLLPLANWAGIGRDNQGSRFLYLPLTFYCAILGVLFSSPIMKRSHQLLRTGLIFVLVGSYLGAGIQVTRLWHQAGQVSQAMIVGLRDCPLNVKETPRLIVTGIPDNHSGAYILRNGFPNAVRNLVNPRAEVEILSNEAWVKITQQRSTKRDSESLFLRWDSETCTWRPPAR